MRVSRLVFVAILGLAAFAPAAQAQATNPEPCPQPGYVVAGGILLEDRNENGTVCVDPETGDIRDDVDPPAEQHKDANHDFIVCYNEEKGVVTDNRMRDLDDEPDSRICPPGFEPYPVLIFW